jgi:diguanylate cyclase (GGDEF)-like protein
MAENDRKASRSFVVVHYVSWVGILAHAGFIGLFAFFRVWPLAIFNVLSVAVWIWARVANQKLQPRLAALFIGVEVTLHAIAACALLGWSSGFYYYLIPLIPFLLFHDQLSTRTVVTSALVVAGVFFALRLTTMHVVAPPDWDGRTAFVEFVNMSVPLLALGLISVYFRLASIDVEHAMEALAMTDSLTRLANRRRMRDLLEIERVRSSRNRRPFAIVLGDIDDFKQINDKRGHDCGDYVLVESGALLSGCLRAQDCIARWGGEEFMILLPDTDARGAKIAAEKLRRAIESAALERDGQRVPVTMTFGAAVYDGSSSIEDCVRRADEALYAGKAQGKNQVVLEDLPQQKLASN